MNLKRVTLKGFLWSLIESILTRGTQFIISIILARLLVPEMFGLIAMLMIFITLGEVFVDSGFGAALIQKNKINESEICSVFYFNVIIGLFAASLLFLTAPIIASFYNQSALTEIARALCPIFIFNSLGMIQMNLLVKRVDFKSQAKITAITNLFSGSLATVLAFMGYGVWSIVYQQISFSAVRSFFYWYYSQWRPSLLFNINELRRMFGFSIHILAIGILHRSSESIYNIVIGKLFSASALGIFSRAYQIQGFPSTTLAMIVGRVAFPLFAKIQFNPSLLKSSLRKTLIIISFLIFPIMVGLSTVAKPLILVLLTNKWSAVIPYLQLLAAVGIAYPHEWVRQQVLQALGKPNLSLRIEILKKISLFINIAIMWYFGIIGIIVGMIFSSMLSLSLNIKYVAILTEYSTKEQLSDMLPYLIISSLMALFVLSLDFIIDDYSPLFQLLVKSFSGFVFYIGIAWAFRLTAIMELQKEFRNFIK